MTAPVLANLAIAAATGIVTVPFFGWLSDRVGRRVVYGTGVIAVGLFAFPYFALLDTGVTGLFLLGMIVGLVVHASMYGPQAALIAESFGTGVRYSGAGLGYQLASITAGGLAPIVATLILARTDSSVGISIYIVLCAVISLVALAFMHPRPPEADEADDASEESAPDTRLSDAVRAERAG